MPLICPSTLPSPLENNFFFFNERNTNKYISETHLWSDSFQREILYPLGLRLINLGLIVVLSCHSFIIYLHTL